MRNKTNQNQTTSIEESRLNNQALVLEQEILGTFLNILKKTENQPEIMKSIQQDFIGYFDSCDYNYLRDGNVILTEIQTIFTSLALADPKSLEIIQQNNKNRISKVTHIFHV